MRSYLMATSMCILLVGCSNNEFSSDGDKANANRQSYSDGSGTGQDAYRPYPGGQTPGSNGSGTTNNGGQLTNEDGSLESNCRFADPNFTEMVSGGPGIAINPFSYPGTWEGESYVFTAVLWSQLTQVPGPVLVNGFPAPIGGAAKDALTGQHTAGLSQPWSAQAPTHGFAAKRNYNGIVQYGKSTSCNVQMQETTVPEFIRPHDGCFALSTPILMADGTEKAIHLIKVGERVYNPATRSAAKVTAILSGPEVKVGMMEIIADGKRLLVTENHPFPSLHADTLRAQNVKIGHRLRLTNGQFVKVTSVKRLAINKKQIVKNLVINPDSNNYRDHVVVANGIQTGDFNMQTKSLKQALPTKSLFLAAL